MTIIFQIDDKYIPSIEQYLKTQRKVLPHPVTGVNMVVDLYSGVQDYFQQHIAGQVEQMAQQFPPDDVLEKLQQIALLQKQVAEGVRAAVRPVTEETTITG